MSNTVKYGLVITIFWVAFKCPPGALSTVRWAPKASTCPLKEIPTGDGGWEGGGEPSPLMPLPQVQQAGPSLKATARPLPPPHRRQLLQLPLEIQLPLGALPSLPRPSRPSTAATGKTVLFLADFPKTCPYLGTKWFLKSPWLPRSICLHQNPD